MKTPEELGRKKKDYYDTMKYLINNTELSIKFYEPICAYVEALELERINLEYEIELLHDYEMEESR